MSWSGVCWAAVAALGLAALPPGPLAAFVVGVALAGRLACANLDGGLARQSGRATPWGAVVNEVTDRLADLVVIAGLLPRVGVAVAVVTALSATLPSWVALAGAAAGARRVQGGPVGKTERCLLMVLAAGSGWAVPVATLIAIGSLLTTALRLIVIRRALVGAR